MWIYIDGWTVLVKKPVYKEYTQEELLKTLNDVEERIRLYRRQGRSKNKVELYFDKINYDYLKQQRILEALDKKPLPQLIKIQEFVDEVSTLSVIFGYLLSFLFPFLIPWVAFYTGGDRKGRPCRNCNGTGKEILYSCPACGGDGLQEGQIMIEKCRTCEGRGVASKESIRTFNQFRVGCIIFLLILAVMMIIGMFIDKD